MKKNETVCLQVHDLNNLGYGVSRHDGKVVFVDGAVAGDTVRAKIIKVARDYAVAKTEAILTPSADRIPSDCAVSRPCGGCIYREITPQAEKKCKRDYVEAAFRKVGLAAQVEQVLSSPILTHYRNKVLYPVGADGQIGFYARHSHRIVPCLDCKQQARAMGPVLSDLQAFFATRKPENLKHLYLRYAQGTGEMMVCPVLSSPEAPFAEEMTALLRRKHPQVRAILLNIQPEEGNTVLGKTCRVLFGDGTIEDLLCGLRFRISPLSFYQVNRAATEVLYEEAIRRVMAEDVRNVADLYCGIGTIGLILASRMPSVHLKGVEIVPSAVENARFNAMQNGIDNATFVCADSVGAEVEGMDCVILDPPRKGCSASLLSRIADAGVKRVVYVSCNPDTLARDAALLCARGYRLGTVQPVDMFPRTGAIECVTDFVREEEQR